MPAPKQTYRDTLPEPQRRAFDRLVVLLGTSPRPLGATYTAGTLIRSIRAAVGGYNSKWTDNLVAGLVAGLAAVDRTVSKSLLHRLQKFAVTYTREDVETFEGKLSWEGVTRLLGVEDGSQRRAVLKRILAQKTPPSSREVQRLIGACTSYKPPRGGAKHGGAKRGGRSQHPNNALRALRALADRWPEVHSSWATGSDSALVRSERLGPALLSPTFLDELERVAGAVEVMARQARELAQRLGPLVRTLRKRVRVST